MQCNWQHCHFSRTTPHSSGEEKSIGKALLAYVQAVGVEVAVHNVQVKAVAQNIVDNPLYFPRHVQDNSRFQERFKREVPLGRLVEAREDVEFAAFL